MSGDEAAAPREQPVGSKPSSDVFISYASQDVATANAIVEALERAGLVCWIAPRDVPPGEFYADAIVGAINASRVLVLALTENATTSPHVLREVERASAKRHPVVSFRIDAAPLPAGLEYFLSASHWLDSTTGGMDATLPKLVEAVRHLIAPPSGIDPNRGRDQAKPAADLFPPPSATNAKFGLSRALLAAMAAVAVGAGYLVIDKLWLSHDAGKRPAAAATSALTLISEQSLAVLPFVDMSEKHDQEYFSDGLSEELIDHLAHIPDLKVIARTSSFAFKGKNEDMRAIAAKLGVANLLEGSVRKAGKEVRITAQLIRASDGVHLWSETYDRTLRDIFAVQDDIAAAVATRLKITLLGERDNNYPGAPSSSNLDAYTSYLQGRYYERRYSAADLRTAIAFYDAAIHDDQHYAVAYAALSKSWWALGDITGQEVAGANRKARAAAERAVAEDPNSAEGHIALGQILVSVDWNAKGAEAEFRRAAELTPESAGAKIGLASVIADFGHIEEAVALLRQAVRIEPLGANSHFDLARLLTSLGRYGEAVQSARKAIELQPGGAGTWQMLALVEAKRGDGEAALKAAMQESDPDWRAYAVALAQQARGDRVAADAALNALIAGHSDDMSFQIATVYAFRGDADETFKWINRAYERRDPGVMAIIDNPFTRELRADPRFNKFCKKVGLTLAPGIRGNAVQGRPAALFSAGGQSLWADI